MKKIFTFIAAAFMAVCASAQTTLFEYTVSQGDNKNSANATVGTVKLGADKVSQLSDVGNDVYGFYSDGDMGSSSKYVKGTLASGTKFSVGDIIYVTMATTSTPDNRGISIYDAETGATLIGTLYCTQKNVAETFSYTIKAGDALVGKSDFYLFRAAGQSTYIIGAKVTSTTTEIGAATATVWDFTTTSSTDRANLEADTENWEYYINENDPDDEGWRNLTVFAARNEYTALKANGVELELTKGLQFARDNSAGLQAGAIFINNANDTKKVLNIASSKVMVAINVAKDDVVKVKFFSNAKAGSDARGFSISNADKESIMSDDKTDVKEETLTAKADGQIVLTTTASVNLVALAIIADLPEGGETGISSVQTSTAANGAVYNLAGQQVDASYKGIVIKDGKKYVQK